MFFLYSQIVKKNANLHVGNETTNHISTTTEKRKKQAYFKYAKDMASNKSSVVLDISQISV